MNPPPTQPADAREALIKAAREVFSEQGFDGARVDQIAQRAGVNKALINYHFGGKTQLLLTIIREFEATFFTRLTEAIDPKESPQNQLRCFIRTVWSIIGEFPAFPRLLLIEAVTNLKLIKEPPQHVLQVIGVLGDILRRGAEKGVFRPMNPFFAHIHLMSSFAMYHITEPVRKNLYETLPIPPETFSDEAFATFVEEQILAGFASPKL